MFLSRVEVDRNNRQKTQVLTHLGAYHNWVEQSFPKEIASGIRHRHLWRLDNLAGREYLLLLSEERPDLKQLERYGVAQTAQTKDYDRHLERLRLGQRLQFRLTANPTYAVIQPGTKRGRVYPHVTIAQQRDWLLQKAARSGFEVADTGAGTLAFEIVNRDHPFLRRKKGRNVLISRVTFEGELRISDLALFKQTLITGIGREKAFGMGLMTVLQED